MLRWYESRLQAPSLLGLRQDKVLRIADDGVGSEEHAGDLVGAESRRRSVLGRIEVVGP
jgi:hypothetical protein